MHDTIENQGSERKKKYGLSKKTYDQVRNGNDRPYLLSYYEFYYVFEEKSLRWAFRILKLFAQ
jgi:hypothetical protein